MEVVPALRRRVPAIRSSGSGAGFSTTLHGGSSRKAPTDIVLSVHGEQRRTRRRADALRVQHKCYPSTIGRGK
jgi:hypothetical protein